MLILLSLCITMPVGIYSAGDELSMPSEWAVSEVKEAINLGIVPVRLQSDYRQAITREEFAELIVTSALINTEAGIEGAEDSNGFEPKFQGKLTPEILVSKVKSPVFTDCDLVHVKAAYILGFVNGVSDMEFNPHASITRQEAATMMANYLQSMGRVLTYGNADKAFNDSADIAQWAYDAVDICYGTGIMKGTGSGFTPDGTYTREQAILCIKRAHKPSSASINLRGKVFVPIDMLGDGWSVGKDWVALSYNPKDKSITSKEDKRWEALCKEGNFRYFKPTANQFDLYLASRSAVIFPIDRVYEQKEIFIDSGYLVSQWFGSEYLIKYFFVPDTGYISKELTGALCGREKIKYNSKVMEDYKPDPGPEVIKPKELQIDNRH